MNAINAYLRLKISCFMWEKYLSLFLNAQNSPLHTESDLF